MTNSNTSMATVKLMDVGFVLNIQIYGHYTYTILLLTIRVNKYMFVVKLDIAQNITLIKTIKLLIISEFSTRKKLLMFQITVLKKVEITCI